MLAAIRRYFTIGRIPVRVGHPYRDRQLSDDGYEPGPNPFASRPPRTPLDAVMAALFPLNGHWREAFRRDAADCEARRPIPQPTPGTTRS